MATPAERFVPGPVEQWLSEPNGGEEFAYALFAASLRGGGYSGTRLPRPDHSIR